MSDRVRSVVVAALVAALGVAGFTACKGSASPSSTGTGGHATTTATASTSTVSSAVGTGGAMPDAGAIDCGVAFTTPTLSGPCDLLAQNCAPNQTCEPTVVENNPTTVCVPAPGLKSAAEPCYASDECAAGLLCIGLTAKLPGTCVGFCCPDGRNLPCNGGTCNQIVGGFGGPSAYMCGYGVQCQLLTQSPCPSGEGCHVETAAGEDVSVCVQNTATPVPELGTCQYINDCADMQQCFHPAQQSTGTCLWYCALSGAMTSRPPGLGGCPNGETCQSTYKGGSLGIGGFAGIGLCFPNGGLGTIPDGG